MTDGRKLKGKAGRKPKTEEQKKDVRGKLAEARSYAHRAGVTCVQDVAALMNLSMREFDILFPIGSIARRNIDEDIFVISRKSLVNLRARLVANGSPTALMNVYKMICTQEERDVFNSVKADITTNGKDIKADPIVVEIIDKASQVNRNGNE